MMKLNVQIDERLYQVDIPASLFNEAKPVFRKMDKDMDKGWQMSREWVQNLDDMQRCQVVADRLLTAIENHNEPVMMMMASYILYKMPNITTIDIDTQGDMTQTQLTTG